MELNLALTRLLPSEASLFWTDQVKQSSFPTCPSSDDWQFGIKIHSSFSGSRFKISRKGGGSPAQWPLKKMWNVSGHAPCCWMNDCLLPAITFTGHYLILQFIARSDIVYLPNDFSQYNLRNMRRLHHIFSLVMRVCLLLSRQSVQCLCVLHYLTGTSLSKKKLTGT